MANRWEQAPVVSATPTRGGSWIEDPYKVKADARADRSDARASDAADRAAAAAELQAQAAARQAQNDALANKIKEAALADKARGKPLSDASRESLENAVDLYGQLKNAVASFDDKYAGNLFGGAENAAQGLNSDWGTPGQKDWWSNFKSVDNQVRNKLFGASLSAGEKGAYGETTVEPSTDPKVVRENLVRRLQQAQTAMQRRVGALRAGGFNGEMIDAASGEFGPDFQKGSKLPDFTKQPPAPTSETSNPGQWQFKDQGQASPVDGMPKLSADDESWIAQNARYMSPQGMEQWYKDKGQPLPAGNAQKVYDYYQKGGRDNPAINYDEKAYRAQLEESNKRKPAPGYTDLYQNGFSAGSLPTLAGLGGGVASMVEGDGFTKGYTFNRDAQRLALEQLRERSGIPGAITEGAGMVNGSLALGNIGAAAAPRLSTSLPAGLRGLVNDSAFAAAYGANEAAPGQGLGGAATGALTAAAGNLAGQGGSYVAGGLASGITSPAARRLYNAGVNVTPGQAFRGRKGMFGRLVTSAEDAASSIPGIGDVLGGRRLEGLEDANKAAFGIGGKPINAPATAFGREGVAGLDNAVTQAYDSSLKPMRLTADPQLSTDLQSAYTAGRAAQNPVVSGAVKDSYTSSIYPFIGPDGTITGEGLQAIKQGINIDRGDLMNVPGGKIGRDALDDAKGSFFSMAERQDPTNFANYRKADEAFANQMALERAVNASSGRAGDAGLFTGAQLANASKARGKYPERKDLANFAQDMVDVLPSQLPDSGTAKRIATQVIGAGLAGGATGAAGYYLDPASAAIVAGATLPFTRIGNKATSALLLGDRPATIQRIGESLKGNRAIAGMFGAPLALTYER